MRPMGGKQRMRRARSREDAIFQCDLWCYTIRRRWSTKAKLWMLIILLVAFLGTCLAEPIQHCRRFRACVSDVRSDYELCVGGPGVAIVGDYESADKLDGLLLHSDAINVCERNVQQKVREYKAVRQLQEEDLIKCAEDASGGSLSEVRRVACSGTPISWALQELAKGVIKKPSQCRELYAIQLERCAFLATCCSAVNECMSNATITSVAHQETLQRARDIKVEVKNCLETINAKYGNSLSHDLKSDLSEPLFKQSAELQKQRIDAVLRKAAPDVAPSTQTASPPSSSSAFPTFPTLPPLPNLFAILFPHLASTASTPVSSSSSSTPAADLPVAQQNANEDSAKIHAAGNEAQNQAILPQLDNSSVSPPVTIVAEVPSSEGSITLPTIETKPEVSQVTSSSSPVVVPLPAVTPPLTEAILRTSEVAAPPSLDTAPLPPARETPAPLAAAPSHSDSPSQLFGLPQDGVGVPLSPPELVPERPELVPLPSLVAALPPSRSELSPPEVPLSPTELSPLPEAPPTVVTSAVQPTLSPEVPLSNGEALSPGEAIPEPSASTGLQTTVPESSASATVDFVRDDKEGVVTSSRPLSAKRRVPKEHIVTFCENALKCEETLNARQLQCGREYGNELADVSGYAEMLIHAQLARNSALNGASSAIAAVCMRPIRNKAVAEMAGLYDGIQTHRNECIRRSMQFRNALYPSDQEICAAMNVDEIFKEVRTRNENTSLNSLVENFDSCNLKLAVARSQCEQLKKCCPGFKICGSVMRNWPDTSRYERLLKEVKDVQNECEQKMMATLKSLNPAVASYAAR